MTGEQLAEIEALLEAATPGPWRYKEGLLLKHYVYSDNGDVNLGLQELHPADGRKVPAEANARLIAHAPQALTELLAEVRRLRSEVARMEDGANTQHPTPNTQHPLRRRADHGLRRSGDGAGD